MRLCTLVLAVVVSAKGSLAPDWFWPRQASHNLRLEEKSPRGVTLRTEVGAAGNASPLHTAATNKARPRHGPIVGLKLSGGKLGLKAVEKHNLEAREAAKPSTPAHSGSETKQKVATEGEWSALVKKARDTLGEMSDRHKEKVAERKDEAEFKHKEEQESALKRKAQIEEESEAAAKGWGSVVQTARTAISEIDARMERRITEVKSAEQVKGTLETEVAHAEQARADKAAKSEEGAQAQAHALAVAEMKVKAAELRHNQMNAIVSAKRRAKAKERFEQVVMKKNAAQHRAQKAEQKKQKAHQRAQETRKHAQEALVREKTAQEDKQVAEEDQRDAALALEMAEQNQAESALKRKKEQEQKDDELRRTNSFLLPIPVVPNTEMPQTEVDEMQAMVVNAMRHSWKGYRDRAWGADEVGPVSGERKETGFGDAVTLIDALTTLKLMGLDREFDEGASWVEQNLTYSHKGKQSFFETTIRGLGGLLGAYMLSDRKGLLEKSVGMGRRLSKAFGAEAPHFPAAKVDMSTGDKSGDAYNLAGVGSCQLEFHALAQESNELSVEQFPYEAMYQLLAASGDSGLVPSAVQPPTTESGTMRPTFRNKQMSLGAASDSYYEYLLKMWLQSRRKESFLKDKWKAVVKDVHARMVQKTKSGLTYVAQIGEDGQPGQEMEHLACFYAGNLELGYRTLPPEEVEDQWHDTAVELTRTCHSMYARTESGLSPDKMYFGDDMELPKGQGSTGYDRSYILRPEAAEAIYYMWHFTGESKYRHMAKDLLLAIERNCRAEYGYATVADVGAKNTTQIDTMESFFLAETLLYLYLTFSPKSALDLNAYVLNTEGHPLRVDTM